MRVELLYPTGPLTADLCRDVVSLVVSADDLPPLTAFEPWSPLELQVVYDWATREMLAASDNRVDRRTRPYLLTDAIEARIVGDATAQTIEQLTRRVVELEEQLDQLQAQLEDRVH